MPRVPRRRGLSLLELLLALVITALIAGAIAGMMGAVSTGVHTRRDARRAMVGANACATRLNAYIAPARALLHVEPDACVAWFIDNRESGTVHASEIRWFTWDAETGTLQVQFVDFPEAWGPVARDLEDIEFAATADWMAALEAMQLKGLVASVALADQLTDVTFHANEPTALASRHLTVDLTCNGDGPEAAAPVIIAATLRLHQPPER